MATQKNWGYQRWDDEEPAPFSTAYQNAEFQSPAFTGAGSGNEDDPWTPSWARTGTSPGGGGNFANSATPGSTGTTTPGTTPGTTTPGATPATNTGPATRPQIDAWYQQYLNRKVNNDAEYQSHEQNPGGAAGVEAAIKDSKEAKGYAIANTYKSALEKLASITDPAARAAEKDKLARQVFTDLQAAGHDVKWNGQNLIIDGREYEFADPAAARPANTVGATNGATSSGVGFEGFDFTRAQDRGASAKDSYAYHASQAGAPPPGADKAQLAAWFNQYIKPGMEADGHKINWVDGDKMNFTSPQGTFTVDWVRGAGAAGFGLAWQVEGDQAATGTGSGAGAGTATTAAPGTAGSAGVGTGTTSTYAGQGASPTPGVGVGTTNPFATNGPAITAPTYDGQTMGDADIPDTSQLGAQLPNYIPTPTTVGDLSAGPIDAATEDLLAKLLANPYSLSDQTVGEMKAADKDAAAQSWMDDQEQAQMAAGRLGIVDSPWLASEMAASKRDRDRAMWTGARDIDIEAAKTRTADAQKAIGLGTTFAASKAQQKLGAETLKANVAQNNQSNLFQAADLKTRQVMGTVDAQLREAALRGDRFEMNAKIDQAATSLGLDRDKLVADWAATVLDDNTRRYLGEMGFAIDSRKLDQSSREFDADYTLRAVMFAENLKLQYAQLAQDDRQFGANYGLDVAKAENSATNSAIEAYLKSKGLI